MGTRVTQLRTENVITIALVAIAMGCVAMAGSMTSAFGAASGTSYAPCFTGSQGATVDFAYGFSSQTGPAITAVTISNLSSLNCDGSPATVILAGNAAGDPGAAAGETLSVLNSTLDPCAQSPVTNPPKISGGTITLATCSSGGVAREPSIHDLTKVVIKVHNHAVKTGVLGEKHHRSGSHGGGAPLGSTLPDLPFTGSWAALTFWIGLLAVVAGGFLVAAARRRRWSPADAQ